MRAVWPPGREGEVRTWPLPLPLPRTTLLVRGAVSGTSTVQPLAANVDVVLVCAGLSAPLRLRRIERLLTLVWASGATPVVVLTKGDLHPEPAAAVRQVQPHAPGCEVVTSCCGSPAVPSSWTRPACAPSRCRAPRRG